MMQLLTLAGLAVALILFLNLLSATQTQKGKDHSVRSPNKNPDYDSENPPRLNAAKILKEKTEPHIQRPRICPVCGTLLGQTDYLFASLESEPPEGSKRKRQAHIYGCRFCFSTDGVNLEKKVTEIEP